MIYLDNAATAKPLSQIVNECVAEHETQFFNPSALYRGGVAAHDKLKLAREEISGYISSRHSLVLTSGGSESDNTAIFSFCKRGNFITTMSEHAAVYNCFEKLRTGGADCRYAPLKRNGSVDSEQLLSLIDGKTTFVAVMHVNNETGAINDINAIAAAVKAKNPRTLFFSDGVQAFGKIPYRLSEDIDAYSISSHKIGGLKGTGALLVKNGVSLSPYILGGGQEGGLRSGTENTLGIEIFRRCAALRYAHIRDNYEAVEKLKSAFNACLREDILTVVSDADCSPYVISVLAKGVRGETVMHLIEQRGIVIGNGSACASKKRGSRTLSACGFSADAVDGALRISFCAENTLAEAREAADAVNKAVAELRQSASN